MIDNNKVLALIPARAGSKGIKDKNIIDLCGKPLIAYTVEASKKSKYIDDIILTTDSLDIANIVKSVGGEVPFIRPAELAKDSSRTIEAVLHAINYLKRIGRTYDILVLLQPTQPLRTVQDIDGALEVFIIKGQVGLVSVSEVSDHPVLMRQIGNDGNLFPLLNCYSTIRRQDMPIYYKVNGCVYINKIEDINSFTSFNDNLIPYVMEKSHSVDIDSYKDLELAKYYLSNSGLLT